ncbi:flagellar hook-length control protein FliK (plasmid) [Salipiger sp. H15]|uniref:Flagellar hook-length control protein FliK n=1 Tax=Alloyangia sp. H15 TaxID=3029062 RepID=A0AAU8AQP7_9RHOB
MINLLATLGGVAAGSGAATDKPAEGETPFAGLLALVVGRGESETAEEAGDAPAEIGDLLTRAEAALDDPDLSEDEIAAILGPVIAQLGAALAADPALLEKARTLVADLAAAIDAEAGGAELAELSWRDLSEGLGALQAALDGAEEVEGDGRELAALLEQVIDVAEEIAQPVVPVVSGLGQLLTAPLRSTETGADPEGLEPLQDVAELPRALSTAADEGAEADLSGQSGDAAPETLSPIRDEPRAAASFVPATQTPAQGSELPTQSGTLALQGAPLAPVTATPLAASAFAAAQVAGTAPQLAVQGQEVLGQIRASSSADGKINVELKPEGLGKVEIALGPDEAGKLQVVVRADQPAVLAALRADRDGLVALLRDAGHAVEDGALSFSDMGTQGEARDGGTGREGARGGFTTYGSAAPEAPGLASGSATQSIRLPEGSVDIRI